VSHQPPFFCPYCGDEGLRPHGEQHGEWQCEACRQVFLLRAVKPARPSRPTASGAGR
jgi:ribosomal protein L37AE/L43A